MSQFSNICGTSPFKNKILFFDRHGSHFYDHALTQIQRKNIQPFILKAGDSINDYPNDNGHNRKLKSLYNTSKAKWMLKYGTTRFQPRQVSSVPVETWEVFTVSDDNIIRDRFAETWLLPLSPPNMKKNTQTCVASIQTSSKVINYIVEDTLAPIQLLETRTNYPMVIHWENSSTRQLSRDILLRAVAYEFKTYSSRWHFGCTGNAYIST